MQYVQSDSIPSDEDAPSGSDPGDDLPGRSFRRGRPPIDLDLRELQDQAQAMRPGFGRARSAYNGKVCDLLAAAGLAPSGNLVLQVGRWGTMGDIRKDVREWWIALAKERAEREPAIPAQARRQALDLVEQMFDLAWRSSDERLREQLRPLEDALAQEKIVAADLNARLEATARELANQAELAAQGASQAQAVQAQMQVQLEQVQAALEGARTRVAELEQLVATIREKALAAERALEKELAAARQALSQAQAQAAQELLLAQQNAEADRRALLLKMDDERTQGAALVRTLTADLAACRQRADAMAAQSAERSMALARAESELAAAQQRVARLESPASRAQLLTRCLDLLGQTVLMVRAPSPDGGDEADAIWAGVTESLKELLGEQDDQRAPETARIVRTLQRGA